MPEENATNGNAYALRRESRTPAAPDKNAGKWRRRLTALGVVVAIAAAGWGGWLVWYHICHVPTLSARVRAAVLELSPRVEAPLLEIFVTEKQMVKQGEVLARLDDSEPQAALQAALAEQSIRQSAFHQAEARARLTTAQVAADIVMAEAQLAVAKAQRESLKAQLDALRERLPEEIQQAETVLAKRRAEFDLLSAGPRSEDIEAARVRMASAKETLALCDLEVRQSNELVNEGIDSKYTLEVRKTRLETQKLALREAELQLAKLEAGPRKEEILAARKGLESEEGNVRLAKLNEVELTKLEKTLAIREAEVAEAEAQLGQARARQDEVAIVTQQVTVAKAELDKAGAAVTGRRAALADTTVICPVDGMVTRVFVKTGELCKRASPILLVSDLSQERWIEAFVDEEDARLLAPGQAATLHVPANSFATATATVTQMGLHTQTLDGGGGGASASKTEYGQPDRVWVKLHLDEPLPEQVVTGTTARGYIRVR